MPNPKAERLARAIASDISIYNQKRIQEGLENDNLFDVLGDELDEGRALFGKKFGDDDDGTFEKAINDTILATRAHVNAKVF